MIYLSIQEMGDLAKWEKQIKQRDKVLLKKKKRKGARGGGVPVRRSMPPVRGSANNSMKRVWLHVIEATLTLSREGGYISHVESSDVKL